MKKPLPGHTYHKLSTAELYYIVKDASEAAIAMRGLDYRAECKYLDQINDAQTILRFRQQAQIRDDHYWNKHRGEAR